MHRSKTVPRCSLWVKTARASRGATAADVRFAPIATQLLHHINPPLRAISGLMHRSKGRRYSITSSAAFAERALRNVGDQSGLMFAARTSPTSRFRRR